MRLLPGSRASSFGVGIARRPIRLSFPVCRVGFRAPRSGTRTSGGDVHYVSVCSKGQVSRIALADVAGHGESASSVAERLRRVLQQHTDNWDQSALMRELNEAFKQRCQGSAVRHGRGLGFLPRNAANYFSPTPATCLCYGITQKTGVWDWLEEGTPYAKDVAGLPLGLISGTTYAQTAIELIPGDTLLLYTDGITESRERSAERIWGKKDCWNWSAD